ncbi:DinB family protein [Catalinimonas sp. 4WD22]|uniref:DinB family protein n=1 Tax=Catalinimonas locisalis TaxID=3133978 RepID=UPI003100C8D3
MKQSIINQLISESDSILYGENWLDATFEEKLHFIDSENAFTQPYQLKSVAELLHHLLVWREELLGRLSGEPTVRLKMSDENNWLPLTKLQAIGWESIRLEFFQSQDKFKAILSEQADDFLLNFHEGSGYGYEQMCRSLIHHDIYHLGQIGITIKFLRL